LMLSPYEKRLIILKLRAMKYKDVSISKLVNVPQDKLQTFVGQRLVSSTTGDVIIDTVVKSAFKFKAGGQYSPEEIEQMENTSAQATSRGQIYIVTQLVDMFNNNLVDLDDAGIYEKLLILKEHLNNIK
ncbi:unnamed protein product, partial [marine sediment metagenome]